MAGEGAALPSAKLFHQALSEERRLIWRITAAAGEVGSYFQPGGWGVGVVEGGEAKGYSPPPMVLAHLTANL